MKWELSKEFARAKGSNKMKKAYVANTWPNEKLL